MLLLILMGISTFRMDQIFMVVEFYGLIMPQPKLMGRMQILYLDNRIFQRHRRVIQTIVVVLVRKQIDFIHHQVCGLMRMIDYMSLIQGYQQDHLKIVLYGTIVSVQLMLINPMPMVCWGNQVLQRTLLVHHLQVCIGPVA